MRHWGFIAAAWASMGVLAGCATLAPQAFDVSAGPQSDQFTVRFDPVLGTPASMVNRSLQDAPGGPGTEASSAASAEASVRALIADRPEWFRLRAGVDDVRVAHSEARGWLRSLRLEQLYRGIPIAGAGYDVRVLANGRVGSMEGAFHPDLNLEVIPVYSAEQAATRAREAFPLGAPQPILPGMSFEAEHRFRDARVLVIVPQGRRYVLAWGVVVPLATNQHARVYVDAANGGLLGMQRIGWADPR